MTQIGPFRGGFFCLALIGSVVATGCSDTHPQVPATFNKLGDNQLAAVGTAVANPPSVSILDAGGKGVPGIDVTFAVASGGGTLTGAQATTNGAGIATAGSWKLGTATGVNTLTAAAVKVPGSPVTFTAIATAGPPTTIVKVSTDPATAPAGSNVDSIIVKVTDQFGNLVAGATVTFAVVSGGGSVSPASATTGVNGQAAARWTIGSTYPTANSATAACAGIATTVTFNTTSNVPVANIRFSQRTYVVDSTATITPSVSAYDSQGNAISGAGITFGARSTSTVTTSGGTVTGAHTGQTFFVATSNDNASIQDSALIVVANVSAPVVIATVPRFDLKADTTFTVPIVIDMRSSGESVGAATLQLTWDPNVIAYVSNAAGAQVPDGDVQINASAAATGSVTMTFADGTGFAGAVQVRMVTFKASTVVGRTGTLQITASDLTTVSLKDLLPKTVTSFYPFRTR